MKKRKHKKNHGDWNRSGAKNVSPVQHEEKIEKDHESDLVDTIGKMEALIATAGLTEEDLKIFNSRLEAAKEKLASSRQAKIEEEENTKAYLRLISETERRVSEFEVLANGNLSSQDSIDVANALKAKINLSGLRDGDSDGFKIRLGIASENLEEAQRKISDATAYAELKSEIENKVSEFESLVSDEPAILLQELPQEKRIDIGREEYAQDKPMQNEQKITHVRSENSKKWVSKFAFALFIILVLGSYGFSYAKKAAANNEAVLKDKTEKYIKDNLVKPGTDLKITDFAKEGNLYKFTVSVGGQNVVSYLTGDGKKLLLNPIDLDQQSGGSPSSAPASATPAPAAEVSQKNDKPEVELFVMSLCPYGVQAEKGILPVIQKLGSKINFSLKFVDYTLHGKKEFDENLNQYCIQKEEPAKFNDYLASYVKGGDAVASATSAKIDSAKNTACIAATDKQFKLTDNFVASGSSPFNIYKDLNDKYGVQGSPSLVVNGQLVDSGRDSASLLKTICSGFSNQPEECKAALSSASPTPGFGN
ncbi:MAG: hypothetical protein PHP62_00610 [Candidatus Moranbacteria bacterium]|nr:hypothetical protein [Candidatus Moranbacteria bacterium]